MHFDQKEHGLLASFKTTKVSAHGKLSQKVNVVVDSRVESCMDLHEVWFGRELQGSTRRIVGSAGSVGCAGEAVGAKTVMRLPLRTSFVQKGYK